MAGTPNKGHQRVPRDRPRCLRTTQTTWAWITQVAEGHGENKADPAKALDLLAKLAEFARRSWGAWSMSGRAAALSE